jgi:hypothetical protein
LTVTDSEWDAGSGSYPAFIIDEKRGGPFTSLVDVTITGNQFSGFAVQSTASRAVVQFSGSASACIDISSHLLFPQFALTNIQATVAVEDASKGVPTVVVNRAAKVPGMPKTDNRQVCLTASSAFTGSVYLDFDQSSRSWPTVKAQTKQSSKYLKHRHARN